ncbi:GDSL-type esterase/lipase family protein [Kitasatospora sp. NPDC054939]
MLITDLRIVFVGDSFVQGIGDPEYRGWVGRVLEGSGAGITAFNLGVRRNTSADVLARWRPEWAARSVPGADHRLVVSFGANDAMLEDGRPRVAPADTLRNLATLLDGCRELGVRALVVGPPPVVDAGPGALERLAATADRMAELCTAQGVPFTPVTRELAADPVWTAEALAGDGAHPGAGGYRRLAGLVLAGPWRPWLGSA